MTPDRIALVARGLTLKECAHVVGKCAEDGSGIEGILDWLRSAHAEYEIEAELIRRQEEA